MAYINPFKTQGWSQGLLAESSTKKEAYGALRFTEDGRAFRYARASEAIPSGTVVQTAEVDAQHFAETGDVVTQGSETFNLVVGSTAVTANMFTDGYFQVYDLASGVVGIGMQYRITSHTTCDASGTVSITIEHPMLYALAAGDYWSLIPNPWSALAQAGSLAHGFAGVSIRPIQSGYYGWVQTGGPACVLNNGNTALGSAIVTSATEGAVKTMAAYDSGCIGYTYSVASVTTKYCPVILTNI